MDFFDVRLSKLAEKNLEKLPAYIVFKLQIWIDGVKNEGLREMRRRPGFHDEPLKGNRQGQRSIRLSRAYRAIYKINTQGVIDFVEIIEVNKHEY